MKTLLFLLVGALLAVQVSSGYALSQYSGFAEGSRWAGSQQRQEYQQEYQPQFQQSNLIKDHVPVIKDGVPEDTPEVQAAKAEHFQAYARAAVLAARQPSDGKYYERDYVGSDKYGRGLSQQAYQKPTFNSYYTQGQQFPAGRYTAAVPNQFSATYAPVDTPEVQQAKAAHFAAVSKAQTVQNRLQYRHKRGLIHASAPAYSQNELYSQEPPHIPVIVNGVPQETPEVQAAKLQHFIAHSQAHNSVESHNSLKDSQEDISLYQIHHNLNSASEYHIPVLGKNGVPLETPEVLSARQEHRLAHYYAGTSKSEAGAWDGHGIYSEYTPVIGPNGVPFDTVEVQAARSEHLQAHAKESAKHNQWALAAGYGSAGYSSQHH